MEHGPETLAISSHSAGLTEVIELTGEFDSHGMVRFRAAIDELLIHHPTGIDIDAAEVTFIDSGGLRALLMAQQIANAAGVGLRVVKTSPSVDRILDMTSLHEVLCAPGGALRSRLPANSGRRPTCVDLLEARLSPLGSTDRRRG